MTPSREQRLRSLAPRDAARLSALLAARAVQNVVLDHIVRNGALGRVPGLYGWDDARGLGGVLMVGALGASWIDARDPDIPAVLALDASRLSLPPRQLSGPEVAAAAFARAYRPHIAAIRWERREHVYVTDRARRAGRAHHAHPRPKLELRRARTRDVEGVIARSAIQHIHDLREDRRAQDPAGFDRRHREDVEQGRWWVAETERGITFQVHVGAQSAETIQIAGVFTSEAERGRGYATAALGDLVDRLLRDHAAVSLCCAEGNHAARRLYERVGFETRAFNNSFLFDLIG